MKNNFYVQPNRAERVFCNIRQGKLSLNLWLIILLSIISIGTSGAATNLTQKINIEKKGEATTISQIAKSIESQTDLRFFYNPKQINLSKSTNIKDGSYELQELLSTLFSNTDISYTVRDKTIVLSQAESTKNKTGETIKTVTREALSGKIVDRNNDPIIGATILIEGTTIGVISASEGRFTIQVGVGERLKVTLLGFVTQAVVVKESQYSGAGLKIVLEEDYQNLDDVIVIGYGTQRRSDLTGAISSVSAEKINSIPSTNIAEMLRGAAAGLQVSLSSAEPGGSSKILIRGQHSLSADNNPLFVVDGVPMASIDDINSNDIVAMEILKDASSQSIYGARAANGVIIVTTKRGVAGKPKISYSMYAAVQTLNKNFDFYNGDQWAAMRKEAFYNAHGYYNEAEAFRGVMLDVLNSGKWVDWEDLMISPAWQHKHDLSIQAGGEKTKFALSFGYFNQDGLVRESDFERVTGRINIDHKLFKNFMVGSNLSFTKSWKQSADGTFNSFITMPPLAKVYEDDGSLKEDVTEAGESHYNPLWNIENSKNTSVTERYLINLFADWKIAKWVSYRINFGMNSRYVKDEWYRGKKHSSARSLGGRSIVSSSNYNDYLLENILNFEKHFTKKHQLDATLMQGMTIINWNKTGIAGTGFPNDDLGAPGVGNANEFEAPVWEKSERRLLSFMGRVRYNLMERYLFTVAVRIDGSTVFGKNNKYGYFPSAAFAWRVKDEAFLKDVRFLSNLKLRLSYGQTGNQGVRPYQSLGLTEKYYTQFGSDLAVGYLPNHELHNPDLKWETSTTANIGLDFGFLNGRIGGSLEFYDIQTRDLLVLREITRTLGYTQQMVNLGHVQNRGIEVTLNTIPVKTKDFTWNLDLTFARNRDKIKKIDGSVDENGNPKNDLNSNWFIGKPINVYYDYLFAGIWQTDDDIANSHMPNALPGAIKIADTVIDDKIDDTDRVIMTRNPDWTSNMSMRFAYKDFDLSGDFYYSHGGCIYNSYLTEFSTGGDQSGKLNGVRRNYWTKNNPSNSAPAPNMSQVPAYMKSLGYQDATYFRLRNVTLGYNFPKSITKKIHLDQIRVYVRLTNYWTISDVSAYSPEQTPGAYPEPKTALIGLNITF